jgi:hypothetical protein
VLWREGTVVETLPVRVSNGLGQIPHELNASEQVQLASVVGQPVVQPLGSRVVLENQRRSARRPQQVDRSGDPGMLYALKKSELPLRCADQRGPLLLRVRPARQVDAHPPLRRPHVLVNGDEVLPPLAFVQQTPEFVLADGSVGRRLPDPRLIHRFSDGLRQGPVHLPAVPRIHTREQAHDPG